MRSHRRGRTSPLRRRPWGRIGCAPSGFRPSLPHSKDPRSVRARHAALLSAETPHGWCKRSGVPGQGRTASGAAGPKTNVQLRLRPPPWNPPDMPPAPTLEVHHANANQHHGHRRPRRFGPDRRPGGHSRHRRPSGDADGLGVISRRHREREVLARRRRPRSSRPRSSTRRCSPASRCGSASTDSSSAPRPSTRSAGRASTRAAAWFRPCPQARRSGSESWAALWSRPAAFPDRRW